MKEIIFILIISISQAVVIGWFLGIGVIPFVILAMIIGAVLGIVVFLSYSELTWFIQDLDKVDVAGKSVLVTGCDSGFGLRLAESLVKKGVFVFAGVLNLSSVGAQNLKGFSSVKVIKMDVTKEDEIEETYKVIDQHIKETKMILWGVVNNAGICILRMLPFIQIQKINQLLEINTLGILKVTQRFTPLLRGHGRIVNITSLAGRLSVPFFGAYCASKFASEAISRTLRMELLPLGITVMTIQPGLYKTNIFQGQDNPHGIEEENVYGSNYMNKCQTKIDEMRKMESENTYEVTFAIESALFNKNPQHTYIPGFKTRVLVLLLKLIQDPSDELQFSFVSIPPSIDR